MNEVVGVFADRRQAIAAINTNVEHIGDAVTDACEGTIVKIIKKMGWKGYIDNVLADWAEVEVIEDSFDKDGKLLPKGTHGWCFGAYLTPLENSK